MNSISAALIILALGVAAQADEGILPPWEEFKVLYRKSIEQELLQDAAQPLNDELLFSIDTAHYDLTVSGGRILGKAALSGKILSGEPEPIPLFGNELALLDIQEISGGALFYSTEEQHLQFLPEGGSGEFRMSFTFLPQQQEENGEQSICLAVPPAIRNVLRLHLPEDKHLVYAPGMADENGVYHFPALSQLCVRYVDADAALSPPLSIIEVDSITHLRVGKNRVMLKTQFQPVRTIPGVLTLHAPVGAQFIASTPGVVKVKNAAEDQYEIVLPTDVQTPFSLDFIVDGWNDEEETSLVLPFIENNIGMEGRFVVEEAEEGQVIVEAEGLVTGIPVEKLGDAFAATLPKNLFYMKAPPQTLLRLSYEPFTAMETPVTVLASQEFYTSFAESGAALSVLRLEVPPEVGRHLRIASIEGADIWSVTVNEVARTVYTDNLKRWVVPLDGSVPSRVEMAFLRQGTKLSLHGDLTTVIPETGLPSRELLVGIALPTRVDLLSLEGPVSPVSEKALQLPEEFQGKQHFFSHAFYKGEQIILSIAYKEPVNQKP